MKKIKDVLLLFLSVIPYLVLSTYLFLIIVKKDSHVLELLTRTQENLEFNNLQMTAFLSIIITLYNLILLIITFIIFKIILKVIFRNYDGKDIDIFFSILISSIFVHLLSVILIDLFNFNLDILKIINPITEILIFGGFYFYVSKNKKYTLVLVSSKFLLTLIPFLFKLF